MTESSHVKLIDTIGQLESPEFRVIQRSDTTPVTVCRQPLPGRFGPREILSALEGRPCLFLLESIDGPLKTARYSILGCDPIIRFSAKHSLCRTVGPDGIHEEKGDPVALLRHLLAPYRIPRQSHLPDFFGGAVGLFSYDMKNYFEALPETVEDDIGTPDCFIVIVETVILFDRKNNTSEVIASEFQESSLSESHAKAQAKVTDMVDIGEVMGLNRGKMPRRDPP